MAPVKRPRSALSMVRNMMLFIVAATSFNVALILLGKNGIFPLSMFIPQFVVIACINAFEQTELSYYFFVGIVFCVLFILLFAMCWIFSFKHRIWLLIGSGIVLVDGAAVLAAIMISPTLSFFIDLIAHIVIVLMLSVSYRLSGMIDAVRSEIDKALQREMEAQRTDDDNMNTKEQEREGSDREESDGKEQEHSGDADEDNTLEPQVSSDFAVKGRRLSSPVYFLERGEERERFLIPVENSNPIREASSEESFIYEESLGLEISVRSKRSRVELVVNGYLYAEADKVKNRSFIMWAVVNYSPIVLRVERGRRFFLYVGSELVSKRSRLF